MFPRDTVCKTTPRGVELRLQVYAYGACKQRMIEENANIGLFSLLCLACCLDQQDRIAETQSTMHITCISRLAHSKAQSNLHCATQTAAMIDSIAFHTRFAIELVIFRHAEASLRACEVAAPQTPPKGTNPG